MDIKLNFQELDLLLKNLYAEFEVIKKTINKLAENDKEEKLYYRNILVELNEIVLT